ncbi:hypothetical protein BCU94_10115 [Shewanella sp. 10N.286.52.C2]|uniref:nucleotide-binding protein n=1 Tax=unclassified Shewanella TaxID=196818 RepID=UPI000CAA28EF|nr:MULTISPECIES: hypothetical protein [unclassified Shewanella]MDO6620532.1 hypothetical protein [Shewanella sp. 6_MG-2023]MDO6777207.1 hypothetical protein [Shewanella sp. 3_MG-2023]PMG30925.1 hypothetical protein BCU94_10115 [Shewanella sp. 10N.286.52.C2]
MNKMQAHCPALFVTAPSSDSGKTTLVAAMARYWSNQGNKVRVFKTGPDFIDPIFHEFASGHPAHHLDLGISPFPREIEDVINVIVTQRYDIFTDNLNNLPSEYNGGFWLFGRSICDKPTSPHLM